jgi:CheY-like chemotaxis protein
MLALVVKPRNDAREALVNGLEGRGVTVEVAATGDQGLSKAELILPDLIVVDVVALPADAAELIRRLKQSRSTRLTPVVALADAPASDLGSSAVVASTAGPAEVLEALRLSAPRPAAR